MERLRPLGLAVPAVEGRGAEGAIIGQVDDVEAGGVEAGERTEDRAGSRQGPRDGPGALEMAGALVVDVPYRCRGSRGGLQGKGEGV